MAAWKIFTLPKNSRTDTKHEENAYTSFQTICVISNIPGVKNPKKSHPFSAKKSHSKSNAAMPLASTFQRDVVFTSPLAPGAFARQWRAVEIARCLSEAPRGAFFLDPL